MATPERNFLSGVIEGFYGPPWTQVERFELFDWMAEWKLDTYLYTPKDDLKHRALWRESYSTPEADALGEVNRACSNRNIRFIYALSPGLDILYSSETDLNRLRKRFEQMLGLGCHDFALLFDDIPDRMEPEDRKRWDSFASAQCHVANAMFAWTREHCPDARFLFCPTPYCGRMAERNLGGEGYLPTLGRELLPGIDVFWTGPEIVSREITVPDAQDLQSILRRKPLIWDNLHANDYDGRRFYCGPYSGRSRELRDAVAGLLVNPNNEFPLNYVPLRTLAEFMHGNGTWDARTAYVSAIAEWLPRFVTISKPLALQDLILFGDCYYLPHEEGPQAEALYELVRNILCSDPAEWGDKAASFEREAARLKAVCLRMTELKNRPLFYALNRRIWELREELDLLERYIEFKSGRPHPNAAFSSDFHLRSTYRGGLVARLPRLLKQERDGTFTPGHLAAQNCDEPSL